MGIIKKEIEVKVCDFCKSREDEAEDIVRKCCKCGKDFCSNCGEIYIGQIGSNDNKVLWLCNDCVEEIVKYEVNEDEDEEE